MNHCSFCGRNEKQVELKGFKGLSSVVSSYVLNGAEKVQKENYEMDHEGRQHQNKTATPYTDAIIK